GQKKRLQVSDAPLSTHLIGDKERTFQTNNPLFDATDERIAHESNEDSYSQDDYDEARDEEYFRRKGQDYAAQLWIQEKRRRESKRAKPRRHNAREIARRRTSDLPVNQSLHHQSRNPQFEKSYMSVLQPTDANKALPRTHDRPTSVMKAQDFGSWHHGARSIQSLAEDGSDGSDAENMPMPMDDQRLNGDSSAQALSKDPVSWKALNAEAQQRLDRLLAGPTPNKPPLSDKDVNYTLARGLINTFKAGRTYSKHDRQLIEPKTPVFGQGTPSIGTKPRTHPPSAIIPTTPQPQPSYITPFSKRTTTKSSKAQPSLRSRPLSHLTLNDFK
ncbi:MAG: hypothetical protein Q9211_007201, partial [Gyalolechia sp. 1 TL-2023]